MSYLDAQRMRDRRLIASLHPGFPIEEPDESDSPPNFDGGVRGELPEPELPWPLNHWWVRMGAESVDE